jgi:hypothetical protein
MKMNTPPPPFYDEIKARTLALLGPIDIVDLAKADRCVRNTCVKVALSHATNEIQRREQSRGMWKTRRVMKHSDFDKAAKELARFIVMKSNGRSPC